MTKPSIAIHSLGTIALLLVADATPDSQGSHADGTMHFHYTTMTERQRLGSGPRTSSALIERGKNLIIFSLDLLFTCRYQTSAEQITKKSQVIISQALGQRRAVLNNAPAENIGRTNGRGNRFTASAL